METFQLTRYEMSQLLLSLIGRNPKPPKVVLQEAWAKSHNDGIREGRSLDAFIATSLPPIFVKVMTRNPNESGLSLNDIVALGSQIENSHYAITAIQNWVKRDLKVIIGSPDLGKKYSIGQAAILFMIGDLHAALDLESIRKLLHQILYKFDGQDKNTLSPIDLYAGYSAILEEINRSNHPVTDFEAIEARDKTFIRSMEACIKKKADEFASGFQDLIRQQREAVSNTIVIAILSVQTNYFQTLSKQLLNASLFLQF